MRDLSVFIVYYSQAWFLEIWHLYNSPRKIHMFETILREVSLAPFHLIDEFIEGFLYAHKKEEIETPQVRKLRQENKRLRMENNHLVDIVVEQERQLGIKTHSYQQTLTDQKKSEREAVRKLKRQLSNERMRNKN